jgi:hypothetical protein
MVEVAFVTQGSSVERHLHPGTERQMLHLFGQRGADEIHIDMPVTVRVG